MFTAEKGNIWDAYGDTDYLLFTANNQLTHDGRLVMGAGIVS